MTQQEGAVAVRVTLIAERRETPRECTQERFAIAGLNLRCSGAILCSRLPRINFCWNRYLLFDLNSRRLAAIQQSGDTFRFQPPLCYQAIRRQAPLQG